MQIEVFSHPKARDRSRPGDDVVLAVPGQVFAVLDGATDQSGAVYNGFSGGRLAAQVAARRLIELTLQDMAHLSAEDIADALSAAVAEAAHAAGAVHPLSTTVAAVLRQREGFRLLLIGDSGIRINGERILQPDKVIDSVSTALRLGVREELQPLVKGADDLEALCRRVVANGLDHARDHDLLTAGATAKIIEDIRRRFPRIDAQAGADLVAFLRGGILTQARFTNQPQHPLGFASIIGTPPRGFGIVDEVLPADQCRSLEIFSDGYFDCPAGTRVLDWERRFAEVEALDPEKTGAFASVKGSTATDFTDDRSVICLNFG